MSKKSPDSIWGLIEEKLGISQLVKNVTNQKPDQSKKTEVSKSAAASVILDRAVDMPIISVTWVWPGWLAEGKLHILAGAPGTGKTTVALSFAAIVSAGRSFPCGHKTQPGNVLFWSGEDDPQDTLNPRLLALKADLKNVYFVTSIQEKSGTRVFDPGTDMPALKQKALELGNVKLIVIDPIVSAIRGDGHKSNDVRRGLQPVVELASEIGSPVLGITHFTKGSAGSDPLERVVGSQAFGALARVVIVASKEASQEEGVEPRRFIARAKSNIGPDGDGFNFTLSPTELDSHKGVVATSVEWKEQLKGSARELLGVVEQQNQDASSQTGIQFAKSFLETLLSHGPVPVLTIKEKASERDISWRTLERAKKELDIEALKTGVKDGWSWKLH